MRSILSFLKSLWPRRRPARPGPAPAPLAPEPVQAPAAGPDPEPLILEEVPQPAGGLDAPALLDRVEPADLEENDDDETDDPAEEEEDDLGPDPFISAVRAAPAETWTGPIDSLRAEARLQALSGPHRIYLNAPVAPGSLAEALNELVKESLVQAQFHDDGLEPYILYTPTPGAFESPAEG